MSQERIGEGRAGEEKRKRTSFPVLGPQYNLPALKGKCVTWNQSTKTVGDTANSW